MRSAARVGDQVIVVDGGSTDGTATISREAGAQVLHARKGRGEQLAAGAKAAEGDILLFLHADARLPASARDSILEALSDPQVIGGNFLIRFLPGSWFTRALEPSNDLRRRLTKRYYGDSAIFVRRAEYRRLNGFEPWPLMHDYEFSKRMETSGRCAYIRDPCVFASARRFSGREIRTLLLWIAIQSLYWAGVSPARLYRFYPDARGGDSDKFMREAARATERS